MSPLLGVCCSTIHVEMAQLRACNCTVTLGPACCLCSPVCE